MSIFRVTVVETVVNWGHVEVEAAGPEEAQVRAEAEYDPDRLEHSSVEVNCFDAVEVSGGGKC